MTEASNPALPIRAKEIELQLRSALDPQHLEVIDESAAHAGHLGANEQGFGTHFRIRIASAAFAEKSRLAKHRLVYDAVQNFIDQGLHALAIDILEIPTNTPSQQDT